MSDDKDPVLLEDDGTFDLHDALYRGRCPDCYEPNEDEYRHTGKISFRIDADPDSPRYYGDCPSCGDHFTLRPTAVGVTRYDRDE